MLRSMRSVRRHVELRRLGHQLPVLGKANSLWEVGNISLRLTRDINDSETAYFVIQYHHCDRAMYVCKIVRVLPVGPG